MQRLCGTACKFIARRKGGGGILLQMAQFPHAGPSPSSPSLAEWKVEATKRWPTFGAILPLDPCYSTDLPRSQSGLLCGRSCQPRTEESLSGVGNPPPFPGWCQRSQLSPAPELREEATPRPVLSSLPTPTTRACHLLPTLNWAHGPRRGGRSCWGRGVPSGRISHR